MRAAVVTALNGPDAVELLEVPEPVPAQDQVLIDVEYAGVGFPDVLRTRGEYQLRPDLPFSPGWEVSGVVRADGGGFKARDRVAAMPIVGGFAESVAVDARMVFPLPDSVSFAQGAALPLNYLTAHLALVRRGRLEEGETVMVQGAAGGLGTAVCSLAGALGARVIAVVSTVERLKSPGRRALMMSCSQRASRTRCAASLMGAAWTWLSILSVETASRTRCGRSRPKADFLFSVSPEVTSRRCAPTDSY